MKFIVIILTLIPSLIFVTPLKAEEIIEPSEEDFKKFSDNYIDQFKLWADCQPMHVVVENLSQEALNIGLTREALESTARSRLQAKNLYDHVTRLGKPWLYINVAVTSKAHFANVQYRKKLFDRIAGKSSFATTWKKSGFVERHDGPEFILYYVSLVTELFIEEFLHVNADACPHPSD